MNTSDIIGIVYWIGYFVAFALGSYSITYNYHNPKSKEEFKKLEEKLSSNFWSLTVLSFFILVTCNFFNYGFNYEKGNK